MIKRRFLSTVMVLVLLMSGCSVVDIDNNLKKIQRGVQNEFDSVNSELDSNGSKSEINKVAPSVGAEYEPYRKINPDEYEHNKPEVVWHEMGETISFSSDAGETEYTVEKAQLFSDIRAAGLSQEDIDFVLETTKKYHTNPLVMLTIRIKSTRQNKNVQEDYANGHYDIGIFTLTEKQTIIEGKDIFSPEIVYFDHHGDDSKNEYGDYWIQEGEELVFQIGILLNESINPENEMVLKVKELDVERKDHVVNIGRLSYEE